MKNEKISKDVYKQLADLRYQIRKFLRFSETTSRKMGITPQQHQLLLIIKGFAGRDFATPAELAERLQVTHHSCVGLIKRCEDIGLVYRTPNPSDGRSIYIGLTDKGLEVLEKISLANLEELKKLGMGIWEMISKIK